MSDTAELAFAMRIRAGSAFIQIMQRYVPCHQDQGEHQQQPNETALLRVLLEDFP